MPGGGWTRMARSYMATRFASRSTLRKIDLLIEKGYRPGCNLEDILASRRRRRQARAGGPDWGLLVQCDEQPIEIADWRS